MSGTTPPLLEFQNLHKSFGKLHVLQGLSGAIQAGTIVAVLGPNGSGKTTFLKILLGLVRPDAGTIYFRGQQVVPWKDAHYRREITYMPQFAHFPANLTGQEYFSLIRRLRGTASPKPYMEKFQVDSFIHKKLGILSGGMRQKINLIAALMVPSRLVILDEPSSGLDPLSVQVLTEVLQEEAFQHGRTILFTSHALEFVVNTATHILFLLEGEILFAGTREELLRMDSTGKVLPAIVHLLHKHGSRTKSVLS